MSEKFMREREVLPPLVTPDDLTYELPIAWDSTMVVAFRNCPHRMWLSYINHIQGEGVAPPLLFGGCLAHGLEVYRKVWFRCRNTDEAFEAAVASMIVFWGDNPIVLPKDEVRTFDRCVMTVKAYFDFYPIESDDFQPHIDPEFPDEPTFEFSFAVPLEHPKFPRHPSGAPFIYTGRMDIFGTFRGLPCFGDEKHSTRGGASWSDQWATRHQYIGYSWACRQLNFKARQGITRGIIIHANDTEFPSTPPLMYPDGLCTKFEDELALTLRRAIASSEARHFSREFGDPCFSYFRRCTFWDSCSTSSQKEFAFLRPLPRTKWDPLQLAGVKNG